MAIPFASEGYCKSSFEFSRDMTGGRLLTNDIVEVRDRTRFGRDAGPEVEAELLGEEDRCSELCDAMQFGYDDGEQPQ